MDDQSAHAVREAPTPETMIQRPGWRKLRLSTRICLIFTCLFILTILLELASRAYWSIAKGVPAFGTGNIIHSFFPELREGRLDEAPPDQNDDTLDVLVLGPSVWYWVYGDVAARFEKALAEKLGRPVRVYNASHSGNTTRDALLVYKMVSEARFDLVVVYHGINDVFLNNGPPEIYRDDYTHAPRFVQIRLLQEHPEHPWFVLPYSMRYMRSRIGEKLQFDSRPRRELAGKYGMNLLTPPAVRANLQEIINLARQRNAQVLLLTNAWYMPFDYTEAAFAAKTLDYDLHIHAVATWGTPESVRAGLKAHNDVIRYLAHDNPDVLFTDMEKLMPDGKQYYHDVCHFTPKGCEVFVDRLIKNGAWARLHDQGESVP
jgi:hypothetical protein